MKGAASAVSDLGAVCPRGAPGDYPTAPVQPCPAASVIINGMTIAQPYDLIDVGGGARLERFGERTVDRPHPVALGSRRNPEAWRHADLRFDRERGWTGPAAHDNQWPVEIEGLTLELRPTDAGQLGLYPEHVTMLPWLKERVAERAVAPATPTILNLFACTGLVTLVTAAVGAAVTHLDASRSAVAWGRRNAIASGLAERPIRWIVDDAEAFTLREARRGHRYAGIVLDPPSYGHGPASRPWRLEVDLAALLAAAARVLEPDGFVLLTAHTPGFDGDRLAAALGQAIERPASALTNGALWLSTADGRRLELGAFARSAGGA